MQLQDTNSNLNPLYIASDHKLLLSDDSHLLSW